MPISITAAHILTATSPDDPLYEIRPSHWNSDHAVTASLDVAASEISGIFSNKNGMSFGLDGTNITGSYTVPQTTQFLTTAMASNRGSDFVQATAAFHGTSASGTIGSNGISVSIGPYITTAALSNHSHGNPSLNLTNLSGTTASNSAGFTLSLSAGNYLTTAMASNRGSDFVQAAAAFAGTNASGTIASNGISVSVGNYITTAALSNHSHGNPTLNLTNLSGTTASNSAGFTLSLSAAAPGAGGGIAAAAGTQTGTSGTVAFVDSNGITFGMSASTRITASHNGLTTARASNDAVGLNTALTGNGVAWTVNSSGISLNVPAFLTTAALSNHSHGNPTLALTNLSGTTASNSAGLTLSLSAAAPGGGADKTISFVEIADGGRFTTCALWNNATFSRRPIFVPFQAEHVLESCRTIRIFASRTGGTVLLATFMAGIYTRANSTSMNLVSSTSFNVSLTTSAQFSGIRMYDFTGLSGMSLSPGGYVLGLLMSYGATVSGGLNIMGGDNMALAGFVLPGTNSTAATHSQSAILPFWGVFNATSAGLPGAVAMSSISGGNGVNSPDIYGIIRAV